MLIAFGLTELSRSHSKQLMHTFQLSQESCRWKVFSSLFEKRAQETSVYEEPCVLKEK